MVLHSASCFCNLCSRIFVQELKALESYDIPDPDYSGYVKKNLFDKTSSELPAKKKELQAKLTNDEATKLTMGQDNSMSMKVSYTGKEYKSSWCVWWNSVSSDI